MDAERPYLPDLVSITLTVHSHFDADVAFVEMVRSRWERRVLRTVVLYVLGRKLEKELYGSLRTMDKEGLMVSVFEDRTRVV